MSFQSVPDPAGILPAIRVLYAAAIDGTRWPDFLQAMATAFDAKGAQVVRVQPRDAALNFSALYGYDDEILRYYGGEGGMPGAIARYQQHFMQLMPTDPRVRVLERYPGRPLSCRLQIREEELHASQVYQDMLRSADVEYSLIVSLPEDDGSLIMLGVFRGKDKEHFGEADVVLFSEMIPHLKQAIRISEHLAEASFKAQVARDALDTLAMGVVLVDRDARIVWANTSSRRIIGLGDGVSGFGDTLTLHARSETAALRQLIASALLGRGEGISPPAVAMAATRPSGREPIGIVVGALQGAFGRTRPEGLERPLAVLFLSLPEDPIEAPAELLRRLYGLTPIEARVCERLVEGQSPQEIAAGLAISVETCRTHLKSTYGKLDVGRQQELVAKVMASPVWRQRSSPQAPDDTGSTRH